MNIVVTKCLLVSLNACAWPKLVDISENHLLILGYDQPVPGLWAGNMACWNSNNRGLKWLKSSTVNSNNKTHAYVNITAGMIGKSHLVAAYAGFSKRPAPGNALPIDEAYTIKTRIAVSTDYGYSWAYTRELNMPFEGCLECTPFGRIRKIGPKLYGSVFYGYDNPDRPLAYFYTIKETEPTKWQFHSIVNASGPGLDETELIAIPNREILAIGRTWPDSRMALYRLMPGATHWEYCSYLTKSGEAKGSGSVCMTSDNLIILTYGFQDIGNMGIAIKYSQDYGNKWSERHILVAFPGMVHGGHPSTVHMGNNRFGTAYYNNTDMDSRDYKLYFIMWELTT